MEIQRTQSLSGGPETTNMKALSTATVLFFMWGFLTCLNDILIPHLKMVFELSYAQAMLVQFAFFSSYFIFAIPAGKLVDSIGYKQSMIAGLLTMAVGALLFLPAASLATFALFLGALVVLAAGITVLQVAANPYVANLGPQRTASSRLNLAQAFNSLGTTVAPYIGSALILGTVVEAPKLGSLSQAALQQFRAQQASTVRMPYLAIAGLLVLLAVALALIKLPAMGGLTQDFRPSERGSSWGALLAHPQLLLGALGIFVYVGAEVSIGSLLVNYMHLPQISGFSEATAAKYVSLYWGGAMIGRFIGSAVLQKIKTSSVLTLAAAIACLLVVTSMMTTGHTAMWAILAVGLFNSIMFPSIFTLGIANLGELTSKGSSLMVCAIVGGAIIPLLTGAIADHIGVQRALVVAVVCYLYIVFFGVRGDRSTTEYIG